MRPTENIKRLIKNARIVINPEVKGAALKEFINELEKSKITGSAKTESNVWAIIVNSRITQIAVLVIVLSSICLLTVSDRTVEIEQPEIIESQVAVRDKTPGETLTLVSINAVYHKGGLEAVEKDYERVYEKMVPWPRRVRISELFEELNGS